MDETAAVTLCIINHNGAHHLQKAFAAVRAQSWSFAEILLIDNASQDDSVARSRALFPSVRVVSLDENLGPGGARNAGFAASLNDLILFQDNDIELEYDTAALLLRRMHDSERAFVVAPRVVYANEPGIVQFDSADCHFLGLMATRNADRDVSDVSDAAATTTSLVTACFLADRRRWSGSAPFDETLGFNLEDHDFGVRASLTGHTLWVEPKARARHGSGTPGLSFRPGSKPSRKRLYYLTLNRWIVVTKCYSFRTLVILAPALILFEFMHIAWLLSQGSGSVWPRACREYVTRRQALREQRSAVQCARRVGDSALLRDAQLPMTRGARESFAGRYFAATADRALRAYWRLVRRWV